MKELVSTAQALQRGDLAAATGGVRARKSRRSSPKRTALRRTKALLTDSEPERFAEHRSG
jgi:hypothetical protein